MNTKTAVATVQASRTEAFIGQVLPPEKMDMLVGALPQHVNAERFQRNLAIAITHHPKLLECDPISVFNEVSKAAALGLYLDPQLGEAYLITGWSAQVQGLVPQLRSGYRGLIKLARQSGQIASVYAHEVCKNDHLEIALGDQKRLVHKPDYFNPRGDVGLYYAVVQFSDGVTDFEPMTMRDIEAIRDRSEGWRAFKAQKIKSTPWASDFSEMAKKTVLRRLLKRIPQSPELADATRIDDEDYSQDPQDIPTRPTLRSRLKPVAALGRQGYSESSVREGLGEKVDPDTGEITQSEDRRGTSSPASVASAQGAGAAPSPKAEPPQQNAATEAQSGNADNSASPGSSGEPQASEKAARSHVAEPAKPEEESPAHNSESAAVVHADDGRAGPVGASTEAGAPAAAQEHGAGGAGGPATPEGKPTIFQDYANQVNAAKSKDSLVSIHRKFRNTRIWPDDEPSQHRLKEIHDTVQARIDGKLEPKAARDRLVELQS